MGRKNKKRGGLVYSTSHGEMCPGCEVPIAACKCSASAGAPQGDGIVRVGRETKGRKGKGVTVITGVPLDHAALKALGKTLKKRCGTGGTVKNGVIEIQGDQRDVLVVALEKEGYTVRRSGG